MRVSEHERGRTSARGAPRWQARLSGGGTVRCPSPSGRGKRSLRPGSHRRASSASRLHAYPETGTRRDAALSASPSRDEGKKWPRGTRRLSVRVVSPLPLGRSPASPRRKLVLFQTGRWLLCGLQTGLQLVIRTSRVQANWSEPRRSVWGEMSVGGSVIGGKRESWQGLLRAPATSEGAVIYLLSSCSEAGSKFTFFPLPPPVCDI